jgi:signal peptidase I
MTAKKIRSIVRSWLEQIILIIILIMFISIFIGQTYDINDVSMEPTFDRQGNRVIVFLTPYLFNVTPSPGSIIIIDSRADRRRTFQNRLIESPLVNLFLQNHNEHMWVKRVIGLPGDRLEFKQGHVYRNGEMLVEEYLNKAMTRGFEPLIVPDGHIYVMGDNRNQSSDSRVVGPIPIANIQGRVIMRFLPFDKVSFY